MRTLPSAVQSRLDAGTPTLERNLIWITATDATTYGYWDGETTETITVVRPSDGTSVSRSFYGGRDLVAPDNEDQAKLVVRALSFSLSGASATVTGMLDATDLRNATIEWYKGYADPATGAFVANPECEFEGSIDGITRKEAGIDFEGGIASDTIEFSCVSHARELTRTSGRTRSYQSGLERSSDAFYRYASGAGHWQIRWGAEKKSQRDRDGGKGHVPAPKPGPTWGEHS